MIIGTSERNERPDKRCFFCVTFLYFSSFSLELKQMNTTTCISDRIILIKHIIIKIKNVLNMDENKAMAVVWVRLGFSEMSSTWDNVTLLTKLTSHPWIEG